MNSSRKYRTWLFDENVPIPETTLRRKAKKMRINEPDNNINVHQHEVLFLMKMNLFVFKF